MSSFIIQDETINKLVNFFVTCAYSKEEYKPLITNEFNKYGFNLEYDNEEENGDMHNLSQRMNVLNKKAYNICYKEEGGFKFFKHDETKTEYNIYQILKSLDCFLYQCLEGDIPKDDLYKTLDNVRKILTNYIITHLPDYKKAKWE